MRADEARKALWDWDKQGKYVFSRHFLRRLFPGESEKTFEKGLKRLVERGQLEWVARGVYLNPHAVNYDGYAIEHVTQAVRPGHYNYVSLESALSEYGVISQIPVDRLTVMTTGRRGVYKTRVGTIELVHTSRPFDDIVGHILQVPGRPLRVARLETALRDLRRVGRNLHMIDKKALEDVQSPEL